MAIIRDNLWVSENSNDSSDFTPDPNDVAPWAAGHGTRQYGCAVVFWFCLLLFAVAICLYLFVF